MPSETVIQLRQRLKERIPGLRLLSETSLPKERSVWPTGLAQIDKLLHGGLPKGAITELASDQIASGSALFVHVLLRHAFETNQFIALVDGRDAFDASALPQEILSRLLWIRCRKTDEALKCTDILLRDRNLPLVILDLKLNSAKELKKIPGTTWYRFQRLIEQTTTAFLVVTPQAMVSSAEMRFRFEQRFTLEQIEQDQLELKLSPEIIYERGVVEMKNTKQSA
jgi:hypothetical protein